ncbi:MAG TPA: AMP-binding protein, partial [Steroidobacteraceae bacterium]|nr:AMP-binding protein [Steroidobacteraceae bacterium]
VVATSGSVRSTDAIVHIGRPIANTQIYILDERHQPVPIGVAGEIYIGGAGVARGYLNRPDLTAERFLKDPFSKDARARIYKTGDLGCWRADGNIEFLGRNDDQVKIRGFRIELGEIETQLLRHEGIQEAAVMAREEGGEKRLAAYVVCRTGGLSEAPSIEALRNHLKAALPEYMVPSAYVYLNQLPLTPNGKLDRRALPVPDDSSLVQKAYEAPQGAIEEKLAGIWQEWLHIERVGRGDNFFELGGHSILAMQIVAEIEKEFDLKLSISSFFENPTIERLARIVLASGGMPRDRHSLPELHSFPANRHEPFPLTEIQQTYLVGRSGLYPLGDISTHAYSEVDVEEIDIARFERAHDLLFQRHEMLRTVIDQDQQQRVLPAVPPYRVQVSDLTGNDEATAAAALTDIRREITGQVKSGAEWPLFESRVTKLPDGRYRIHSLIDALIADAFSVQILARDMYQCYDGLEDLLEPIDVSFRDYVLAIEEHKRTQPYLQSKRYWLERLNTLPGAPELPVNPHRTARANGEFRVREKRYEPAQWEALKRRAATHGLTPSNLLLSAYAAVIATWSKKSRFLLNLTLFNRLPLHPHINRVVGDFTSLTLLEIDCKRQDFQSFALAVQKQLWQDLEHRHFSGVDVLRERARSTDNAATSVVPVVFTSAIGGESLIEDSGGSQQSTREMHILDGEGVTFAQTSQVWLDHSATEEFGCLRLNWNSVDALFEPGVLDNMFDAYIGLLDEILQDDRPLQTIGTNRMPAAQLAARAAVNGDKQRFADVLLHQLVADQVAATPAAPAIIAGDLTLSYAELWAASGVLAERLLLAGVRSQDRVAIVMHKGWEQVIASLAIVRVGAAYVPIDRSLPPSRRNLLISNVGASVALVQEDDASELPSVNALVVTREIITAQPSVDVSVTVPTDAVAYVIFTSGSTGMPKGVVIDHAGAVNTILDINR